MDGAAVVFTVSGLEVLSSFEARPNDIEATLNNACLVSGESSIYFAVSGASGAVFKVNVYSMKNALNIIYLPSSGLIEGRGWKSFETLCSNDSAQFEIECRSGMPKHPKGAR